MSETNLGMDENIAGALAYLLGFITGIFLLVTEEDNEFVRFHAAQSIVVSVALFVLSVILNVVGGGLFLGGYTLGFISVIFGLLSTLVTLIAILLWLYLMYMAYQGNKTRIPVAVDVADDLV